MPRVFLLYLASVMLRSLGVAALAGMLTLRLRNVALRHAVWSSVLGILLLMPITDAVLPAAFVPQPIRRAAPMVRFEALPTVVERTEFRAISGAASLNQTAFSPNWWSLTAALYGLVAAILIFRLGAAYLRVCQLRSTGRRVQAPISDELLSEAGAPFGTLLESDRVRARRSRSVV